MPLAALLLSCWLQGVPPSPPSPEQVRAAVQALESAFESPRPAERIAAIRAHALWDAPAVAAQIARGLKDRDGEVRLEAIGALGASPSKAAFEALLEHHREQRRELRKQERVLPRLLVALARHGDPRALPALIDDVQAQMLRPTLRARILGLANLRTKASIEALFQLAATIGFVEMHNHAEDMRLALLVLTGSDQGRSLEAWKSWWAAQREGFEVAPELPPLAKADAERWTDFWADSWSRPPGTPEARGR